MSSTTIIKCIMIYFLPLCVIIGKLFRKNFLYKGSLFFESLPFKSNNKIVVIKQTFDSLYKFKAMKYHIKYHIFTKLKKIVLYKDLILFCQFFSVLFHIIWQILRRHYLFDLYLFIH